MRNHNLSHTCPFSNEINLGLNRFSKFDQFKEYFIYGIPVRFLLASPMCDGLQDFLRIFNCGLAIATVDMTFGVLNTSLDGDGI